MGRTRFERLRENTIVRLVTEKLAQGHSSDAFVLLDEGLVLLSILDQRNTKTDFRTEKIKSVAFLRNRFLQPIFDTLQPKNTKNRNNRKLKPNK